MDGQGEEQVFLADCLPTQYHYMCEEAAVDALRDPSCLRDLFISSPLERFRHGPWSVVAIASKPSNEHHYGRYRYRLFFIEGSATRPVMAINMESDILGTWRLTKTTASGSAIVTSFDIPPDYESFKSIALATADSEAEGNRTLKQTDKRKRPPHRTYP
jgi:hypothetical protein